jgi:hypothetical protein
MQKNDKEAVDAFMSSSAVYYEGLGSFKDFCNSEAVGTLINSLGDKVKCTNDQENDGNGVQIIIDLEGRSKKVCKATVDANVLREGGVSKEMIQEGKIPRKMICVDIRGLSEGLDKAL